jgi:dolichyl-phosphate beta-glucosyltransferase
VTDAPRLSLIVPAYDEVDRIEGTLRKIFGYLDAQDYPWELLVVLDGGRPGAHEKIRGVSRDRANVRVLDNTRNRGKGYSVRAGALAARGQRIAFIDADLSMPIEGLAELLALLDAGADVVIASRSMGQSSVSGPQPMLRRPMGALFNAFVRAAALPGISDSQCGFKGFRRQAAASIFSRQRLNGFGFDVEVLWLARKDGLVIREMPVTCVYHGGSSVSRIGGAVSMVADVLRVRAYDALGKYDR